MITTLPALSSPPELASLPHFNRPTYLMCPPEWYDVDYVINPWMAGNLHQPSRDTAFMQWKRLYQELQRQAESSGVSVAQWLREAAIAQLNFERGAQYERLQALSEANTQGRNPKG